MPREPIRAALLASCVASLCAASLCVAAGCGGAPPPASDEDIRSIQRHEAALLRGLALAEDARAACANRLAGAESACAARDRICGLSDAVDDGDVRARCGAAGRACSQAEAAAWACPETLRGAPPEGGL